MRSLRGEEERPLAAIHVREPCRKQMLQSESNLQVTLALAAIFTVTP